MLRLLNLLPVYDSSEHELVPDLIIPLLSNSTAYLRGVGFFSSGWLQVASQGMKNLIENGGKARIVISPILSEKDWNAFQCGEEAKHNEILKQILEKNTADIATALEKDTLNTLSWMIADGLIEFKFAVATERYAGGDYHDKVAIFTDSEGSIVAIHGSYNDSIHGTLNGEAFSVFKSWEEGHKPFIEQHQKRLTQLWETGNRQFMVFNIPDAIKKKIVRLRTTELSPYSLPQKEILNLSLDKPTCGVDLRTYQEEAINLWIHAGCRGIMEMATGTGKTSVALACSINRYKDLKRLAVIILVPYLHLLEQWKTECQKFGFHPILCGSSQVKWEKALRTVIEDFNIRAIDNICILAVHDTAIKDRFQRLTMLLSPDYTMLIGDEVHNLGASNLRKALTTNADMRLGLSATPYRWFDDEGTQTLFTYFNSVCFEYTLQQAIQDHFLTPYEYKPEMVNLTASEMADYEDLSEQISILYIMAKRDGTNADEKIKILAMQRASILASAEQKFERLLFILREQIRESAIEGKELGHILIYCAPGTHRNVLRSVANLGLRAREFVHTVPLLDRQEILNNFANGNIQVIVAIKCLDEGVDVPATKTAFILASTTNPREFVQRRGRILRLFPGKNRAIIYDFIVTPREEDICLKRDADISLLKRELPRFVEFASGAMNEFEARNKLWNMLDRYQMLYLLDRSSWDVYQQLTKVDDNQLLL